MRYPERKKKILEALQASGSIEVQELAPQLAISEITLRRDLQQLAEEGLLIRTHGGATRAEAATGLYAFADKYGQASEAKQRIGAAAAALVQPGDTIFLDCGSTVFAMCAHLRQVTPLRIVTNSLPVLAALIDCPGIQINLVGGEVDAERKAVHGNKALEHIRAYHGAKAFIGTDGISAEKGLSAFSEKEASMSKAMAAQAHNVFLLCASEKIGHNSYLQYAPLSLFHHLITDKQIPAKQKKALQQKGVQLLLA